MSIAKIRAEYMVEAPPGDNSLKKLHRYIFGELFTYFFLCLFLLTFVLLLNRLFQLTELIINKGVPIAIVGKLLLTIIPVLLLVTLPMATLVTCILVFSRLSNDNEFIAMTASGMSLYAQLAPVALLGLISAAVSAFLMIYGLPWSHNLTNLIRYEILQTRAANFEIKEQVFNDSFDGLVIFVRNISKKNHVLEGVLISDSRLPDDSQVIFSSKGMLVNDPENRKLFLRLVNGSIHKVGSVSGRKPGEGEKGARQGMKKQYHTALAENQYQLVRFGTYNLNLDVSKTIEQAKALRVRLRSLPIQDLKNKITTSTPGTVRHNAFLVELHKRFAAPITVFILALLGAPLGVQNLRSGRHGGFAISLALLFLYYIFATFSEGLGENGRLPAQVAVWGPNIFISFVALWAVRRVARKGPLDIFGQIGSAMGKMPILNRFMPNAL